MKRLNIGASIPRGMYRNGWINLDCSRFKHISVVGSALQLPFKDNSINLIHCVHVLEHVTRDKNILMLDEMARVLKPGGEAWVEVPDFTRTIEKLHTAMQNNNLHYIHIWTTSIYGKNERPGMAHYWGFTEQLLTQKMEEVGFSVDRRYDMISEHYKQEPVLLMRGVK